MRQFNFPHILPIYTAFVSNLDVYVITPIMCYNSCRDAMNNYFMTGKYIDFIKYGKIKSSEIKYLKARHFV